MQEVGSTNPLNHSLPIVALDLWLPYNPYNLSHKSNREKRNREVGFRKKKIKEKKRKNKMQIERDCDFNSIAI
jgi:hypothetical protein